MTRKDLVEKVWGITFETEALHFHQYQLQIQDMGGQTLFETKRFPSLDQQFILHLPTFPEGALGDGQVWSNNRSSFLVLQARALRQKGSSEQIRLLVALDTSQKSRTLSTYRRLLFVLLGLGVLLAAVVASLIAFTEWTTPVSRTGAVTVWVWPWCARPCALTGARLS